MGIFLIIFFVIPVCRCCNANYSPRKRAKIVENYVLSAKFGSKTDIPQLQNDYGQPAKKTRQSHDDDDDMVERKEDSMVLPSHRYHVAENWPDDYYTVSKFADRDVMVHHHHHDVPVPPPGPPPPPPPPPPPAPPGPGPVPGGGPLPLASPTTFFAIGFIGFLTLLNALQTTLLVTMKTKPLGPLSGGLGSTLGGVLGRRRRSTKK